MIALGGSVYRWIINIDTKSMLVMATKKECCLLPGESPWLYITVLSVGRGQCTIEACWRSAMGPFIVKRVDRRDLNIGMFRSRLDDMTESSFFLAP